jgi:proteasome lid subunit RPN8/RPN11
MTEHRFASVLTMPRRLAIQLLHEAQVAAPNRVCGLVSATAEGPANFVPVANAADEPSRNLVFDPVMAERSEAELRARGTKLWAVYASFPTRAGEPDAAELLASPFPVAAYLAISLNTKGVLEMRAWHSSADGPLESVLAIND